MNGTSTAHVAKARKSSALKMKSLMSPKTSRTPSSTRTNSKNKLRWQPKPFNSLTIKMQQSNPQETTEIFAKASPHSMDNRIS